jgi:2-polyprenyl-6-methoxyphenol hydroxylase-like FAD-dependent oxidoreductase
MADFTKHFVVVGGSLAGLFTGIMLTRLGHDVTIRERTPAEALADQGAGIIVHSIIPPIIEATAKLIGSQSPIFEFLKEYDRTHTIAYAFGKRGIQYLKRDGTVLNTAVPAGLKELGSTSWDLLYNVLRATFDGGYATGYVEAAAREEGGGKAVYLSGARLTSIQDLGNEGVKVEYESSNGSDSSLIVDFVLGADGPSSTVRKLLLPQVERTYAGYVAWRGTVKKLLVSEETRILLRSKILTVFHRRGHQILV